MWRGLLAVAAAAFSISCSTSGTPASPPASPSPASTNPAPTGLPLGPPSADILDGPQGGLPPTGGVNHLDLEQAASEQQNQPLALVTYREWGWVDEATRTWAGGGGQASESLLLLTKEEGARLAFADMVRAALAAPAVCQAAVKADECAQGPGILVGRLDRYLFTFKGSGVDLDQLAALQVARIERTTA